VSASEERARGFQWPTAGIVLTVCVFAVSHLPLPEGTFPADLGTGVGDKVPHALVYGGLTWLYLLALARGGHPVWRPVSVVLLVLCIGAVDEVTQVVVGRSCLFNDWLADAAGTLLAGLAWCVCGEDARGRHRTEPRASGAGLSLP